MNVFSIDSMAAAAVHRTVLGKALERLVKGKRVIVVLVTLQ